MAIGIRVRVERGIRRDRYGYEVYYTGVGGRFTSRRFPAATSLESMRAFRDECRAERAHARRAAAEDARLIKPSPDGWCYIYFVRCGALVKIGRAADVADRLRKLQTASSRQLALLAAIPGHAVFEPAIHQLFRHLRENGEWFRLDDELVAFIEHAKKTRNLVTLLWGEERGVMEQTAADRELRIVRDADGRAVISSP